MIDWLILIHLEKVASFNGFTLPLSQYQLNFGNTMSETLCLQWNDFKENVVTAFGSLRGDTDFTDVTLACEDGQQMEAHKIVLATSSPFFRNLFKRNSHVHPLVYMRGVKSRDMASIIDFLYQGEANVYQDDLDSFLTIAHELQLNGLQQPLNVDGKIEQKERARKHLAVRAKPQKTEPSANLPMPDQQFSFDEERTTDGTTLALANVFSEDLEDLDTKVRSLMDKNSPGKGWHLGYICKVCGKEGQSSQVQKHIESRHLEGVSVSCNICEKICRSRRALSAHKQAHHN